MKKTAAIMLIVAAIIAVLVSAQSFAQPGGRAGRGQRPFYPQTQPLNPPVLLNGSDEGPVHQPEAMTPDGPPYGDFGLDCPNPLGPYYDRFGRGGDQGPGFGPQGYGPGWGMQGRGPGMGLQPHNGQGGILMPHVLRLLNLTDEQQEKIRTILEEKKEPMEAARTAVQNANQALHQAVMEEKEEAAIRAAAQTLGEAIGNQAVLRASIMTSIKAVLTEEQLKKLGDLKKQGTQWLGPLHLGPPGIGVETHVQGQPSGPEPNQPTLPFPPRQGRRGRW